MKLLEKQTKDSHKRIQFNTERTVFYQSPANDIYKKTNQFIEQMTAAVNERHHIRGDETQVGSLADDYGAH